MRELKILLRVELKHILHSLNPKAAKGSTGKGKAAAFYAIILFSFAMMIFYAFVYSAIMADAFTQIDALYLLPGLMMTASCLMMLFTTVYKVKGTVFGFKDYDLLMSLPVKTSTVVISRMTVLYTINFLFCLFLMLPAGAVYAARALPGPGFYIAFLLTFPFIPLVPIAAASVLGTVIHLAAARFKHKNIANLIITMSFFMGIMFFSFNTTTFINNAADIGMTVMKAVNRYYPLALMYTNAVCKNDYAALAFFISISVVVFSLFAFMVSRRFKTLNTLIAANRTASDYRIKPLNVSSPARALYKRELKRYFSSANYVLNTGVGLILFTMASVALVFMGSEKLGAVLGIPGMTEIIVKAGPVAVSVFVVLSCTTACSISLEGKHLWIIKSIPVSVKSVFLSKAAVNLTLVLPAVFVNTCAVAYVFRFDAGQTALMFLVPAVYAVFISLAGLAVNLQYPNFDWATEITVIKQSAAVLLTLVIGLLSVAAPLVVIFTVKTLDARLVTYITLLILIIADISLCRYLLTKGVKTFNSF